MMMEDTVDQLVGAHIGNYQVTGLLGQGGMGRVYRAEHPEISRQVAIKVVSNQFALHPVVVGRFRSEAQAVNKIGHPNIVDISDFGALPDGRPYFVMELLEGESLGDRLKRKQLTAEEAGPILDQTLDALGAAHAAGIIHRDLKPDNIFLSEKRGQQVVKLLDFGIAKLREDGSVGATVDGQVLGTPLYMSPEQATGRASEVAPASDLYSLGVVLYEMFTGDLPFRADAVGMLVVMHAAEEPPPPSSKCAIDPRLEAIILRCLAKAPAARFSSAEELRAALAEVLPGMKSEPLPVTTPMTAPHTTPMVRHSPVEMPAVAPPTSKRLLVYVTAGALALGGLGMTAYLQLQKPKPLTAEQLIAAPHPGPVLDGKELP